jgi:hypothetical protein
VEKHGSLILIALLLALFKMLFNKCLISYSLDCFLLYVVLSILLVDVIHGLIT